MKFITLTNWSVQEATGFPKGHAPLMLTGIDQDTSKVLGYDTKHIVAVDGKVIEYYGPVENPKEGKNERVILTLSEINPAYEKHIRRFCIETWDPNNPIRLENREKDST